MANASDDDVIHRYRQQVATNSLPRLGAGN